MIIRNYWRNSCRRTVVQKLMDPTMSVIYQFFCKVSSFFIIVILICRPQQDFDKQAQEILAYPTITCTRIQQSMSDHVS